MQSKVYLKIGIGDCEFIEEFTLEVDNIENANKIKELIDESSNNIVFTKISTK